MTIPTPTPSAEPLGGQDNSALLAEVGEALEGLQPLTGQSEDRIWRPANRAWNILCKMQKYLEYYPPGEATRLRADLALAEAVLIRIEAARDVLGNAAADIARDTLRQLEERGLANDT